MTLQERLRASAKELVRLLEEDLEQKKFQPEPRMIAKMNIVDARKLLQRLNLKPDTELEIFIASPYSAKAKPVERAFRALEKMAAPIVIMVDNGKAFEAILVNAPQKDQPQADTPPCSRNGQHLCPARGLENAPVCRSIVCACARIGESPCPEVSEIVVKQGETIRFHLVKPIDENGV